MVELQKNRRKTTVGMRAQSIVHSLLEKCLSSYTPVTKVPSPKHNHNHNNDNNGTIGNIDTIDNIDNIETKTKPETSLPVMDVLFDAEKRD